MRVHLLHLGAASFVHGKLSSELVCWHSRDPCSFVQWHEWSRGDIPHCLPTLAAATL